MRAYTSQRGIALPLILAIVALAVIVGAGAYFFVQKQATKPSTSMVPSNVTVTPQAMMEKPLTQQDIEMMLTGSRPTKDAKAVKVDNNRIKSMLGLSYPFGGTLMGEESSISGVAKAGKIGSTYYLLATSENLSPLKGKAFYEGWLIRKEPFDLVSTGKIIKYNDKYTDAYASGQDLTDHSIYALTLQEDEKSSSAGKIILFGELKVTPTNTMKKEENKPASSQAVIEENGVKTVAVSGKNFSFTPNEIRVKKGDKVKINFTSTNGFHDWKVDEFQAATKRVNSGETASVEFTASKVGTFEFYCSVGSHRAMGMKGKLIVE